MRKRVEKKLSSGDREKLDQRLSSGELILTVEVGDAVTAYPLDRIGSAAVNDQVGAPLVSGAPTRAEQKR